MKASPIILATFLFLAATGLSAQRADSTDRPDPAERAEQQTERLTKVLELTPEQSARALEINQAFASQLASMREQGEKDRTARRETLTAAREEHRQALEAVLNPEQQAKLEALMEQRETRRGDRKGEGRERRG